MTIDYSKQHIGILIPTKGEMKTKTVESLLGLLSHNQSIGLNTGIIFAEGTLLTSVRSRLVQEFVRKQYTHLFFLDSDMTFNHDMMQKLMDHKKSVICGIAKVRGGKHWNIFNRDAPTGKYIPYQEVDGTLTEIDGTGCACVLIERPVVEEILNSKSLACADWKEIGSAYNGTNMIIKETIGNLEKDRFMFSSIGEKSEDITMCEYIKKCGYNIYADTSVKLGHINDIVLY